jgi:acyl-CoA synthetase (AMP-forming)/AMP-acid ligase II
MIKTSGSNVAPLEVEVVLRSLPGIRDAHVLGIPDDERGEIVAALVVPAEGARIDTESVRDRCRVELSNYKVPRLVVVAKDGEIPMLASGKPDRLAIRATLAAARAGSA